MDSEVCYSNAAAYAGSVDDGDDDDDDNECRVNVAAHGRRSLHEGKHEQTVEHLMGYMTSSSSTTPQRTAIIIMHLTTSFATDNKANSTECNTKYEAFHGCDCAKKAWACTTVREELGVV